MKTINLVIIFINILVFILMGIDKKLAISKKQRISEFTLLVLSFLGGSIGTLIGMYLFHHKTKKVKFLILVPISLILNIIIYLNI